MHIIGALIIGLVAGWLTGKLMRGRGYGVIMDIVLGLIGGVIGTPIFEAMGIVVHSFVEHLAMALVGAIVLVGLVHLIRGAPPATR